MATTNEIRVPDIGGATDVEVIEVMVKPGDTIAENDSIITLETDKASMEVPAPKAGVVKNIKVSVGDKVEEGSLILTLEAESSESADEEGKKEESKESAQSDEAQQDEAQQEEVDSADESEASESHEVKVPDIGGATDVDVIEVMVKPGDTIAENDSIITLETDKASMEVPAPSAGKVESIAVSVGDKVSEGSLILTLSTKAKAAAKPAEMKKPAEKTSEKKSEPAPVKQSASSEGKPQETAKASAQTVASNQENVHAGPAVRRLANELGVDLSEVKGSGRKDRILLEDIHKFVKSAMTERKSGAVGGLSLAPAPAIDFSKFGDIEEKALSKIKRLTGVNVHRSWVTIPHVTQFDEADITDMEAFRQMHKKQAESQGIKLTPLVFIMKAVVACLKAFPTFNASMDPSGEKLILKKYFNIGVAVDTPNGLVVPVVRDVDKKGLLDLAKELGEISSKARDKGLGLSDMQGGCMTISSLGGISGTAFTPIVNSPEVAILGVSKSKMSPVFSNGQFIPRLMLPLSLSYDHRVIDGAEAARFTKKLTQVLSDISELLL